MGLLETNSVEEESRLQQAQISAGRDEVGCNGGIWVEVVEDKLGLDLLEMVG